ncbi:MAG: FxsA family protein [Planctomycetaceae bacterium]
MSLRFLLLLFTIVPLIELALLVLLGKYTSVWVSVGLVFVTGVIGSAMLHRAGRKAWQQVQGDLAGNRLPAQGMSEGLVLLVSGILLLTPGMLTDVVGILLLIPAVRRIGAKYLKDYFLRHFKFQSVVSGFGPSGAYSYSSGNWGQASSGDTLEGELASDGPEVLGPEGPSSRVKILGTVVKTDDGTEPGNTGTS